MILATDISNDSRSRCWLSDSAEYESTISRVSVGYRSIYQLM